MTVQTELPGLYSGKINLWVEDAITRDYLLAVWPNDPSVKILVGAGADSIAAAAKDAEAGGIGNVFAFVDRDHRETNRPNWQNPSKTFRRFVASVYELENFLLDPRALIGCLLNTNKRSIVDVEQRLRQHAQQLQWWVACRLAISEIRDQVFADFLTHPACDQVSNKDAAYAFLCNHPWWPATRTYLSNVSDVSLLALIEEQYAKVEAWLQSNDWLHEFPGKELYRGLRGWLYTAPDRFAPPTVLDSDLAKSIAQWQVENNAVPTELTELLQALQWRVAKRNA
jgi:hypothetical protein